MGFSKQNADLLSVYCILYILIFLQWLKVLYVEKFKFKNLRNVTHVQQQHNETCLSIFVRTHIDAIL